MTDDDGRCTFYYVVGRDTFGRTIDAIAYYDPQGAGYARAVSNIVELTRRDITPDLTAGITSDTARFGDLVHVHGRLTADGSFPVPDRPIAVSLSGCPDCRVTTSDDGSYDCDLVVSSRVPAGRAVIVSRYDAAAAPGDALTNASSPPVELNVFREATSLTLSLLPPVLRGGEEADSDGVLESDAGKPVAGENVGIYVNDLCVGGNQTDAFGRYDVHWSVLCDLSPGTYPVYAAYRPDGDLSLTGSQSSGYTVTFEEASPTIRVSGIPLIAFQGDTLDLLVNVTAMGTPVNESRLTVNMSGQTLGQGMTDDSGSFSLRGRVNGSAGLQSITINSTGNGLLAAADISAGALLVSPFDLADQPGHRRHRPGRRRTGRRPG